jgi:WD40 repeat protein
MYLLHILWSHTQLETDPIPTDMESDMRIAPDPNTSSSSSSSSPSSSRHQHPLSFATDNERRTAMRTENVYRALKRRKVHTPVRERARGQGGVNSSPHGRSKLAHVAQKYIPDVLVEQMSHHSRVFCGQFSLDGSVYTSASQDQHIRLFKVDGNHNWKWYVRACVCVYV